MYSYEHNEQSDRFDVTIYPGVIDPDAELPSDYEPVVVHSKSVTETLVSDNVQLFVELVKLASD